MRSLSKSVNWSSALAVLLVVHVLPEVVQCSDMFNMTEYNKLPVMYKLDDFDKCLTAAPKKVSVYCLVKTEINPSSNPERWKLIEKYSQNKNLHFDHDVIERGICITWCQQLIANLDNFARERLSVDKINTNSKYTFPPDVVNNTREYQKIYNELINSCINYELRRDYNLTGHSEIKYCVTNVKDSSYDLVELIFIGVIGILAAVLVFSTCYDFILRGDKGREHYKHSMDGTCNMLLVSFSLPRNWYRLTMENPHELNRELRFIQGLRFIALLLLIYCHSQFIHDALPVRNPETVEQYYYYSNGIGLESISFFFSISGFLCGMLFMNMIKDKAGRANLSFLWMGVIQRYIRLTPVYAFVILLHSTFIYRLSDGPVWDKYIGRERYNCRMNWWINLLYLNNYWNTDHMCMLQGWYLGAEFHCFILTSIILTLIWRFPLWKTFILGVSIAAAFISVGVSTYLQKLDPVILISLRSQQHDVLFNENLKHVYIPTHMNLGGAVFGVSAGIIYYYLREKKINVNNYISFKILWYTTIPFLLGLIMMSRIFIFNEFEKPSVWIALYATLIRNLWPLFFTFFYIGCSCNTNEIVAGILKYPLFRPLGRISYSIYLCHYFVTLVITSNLRDPAYFNMTSLAMIWTTTLTVSCILGFLLCLCIEFPISAIFKLLTKPSTVKSKQTVQETYKPNVDSTV